MSNREWLSNGKADIGKVRMTVGPHFRSATYGGVLAILLWSSLALMTVATANLPPFELLSISFAIGGLSILLIPVRGRGRFRDLRQPWPAFALAVTALFSYHALYFIAFRNAPAIEVNLINYLWPLLIVVFAAFLPGSRLHPAQLAGSSLGLLGVVIMLGQGRGFEIGSDHWQGYLAALGAALVWSSYSVLNRRFHAVPSSAMGGVCLVVAMLAGITHFFFEDMIIPQPGQWLLLVLMGLGPVGIAFRLWDSGTKHGDLGVLGTLSYAAPMLSTALLALDGDVAIHWSHAIAVFLLMCGAWISVRNSSVMSRRKSD